MIRELNTVLDHFFKSQVTLLKSGTPPSVVDGQVRFQPPDDKWRGHVQNLLRKALSVYLVDLRENRKLRSNERTRSIQNGIVNEEPAPARMDCHYLISAESPTTEDQGKTIEEHQLLYEVSAVLMKTPVLVPRQVFAPDPLPSGFSGLLADAELPMSILPVEGFPKLAEFWGTMGEGHRWKPVVYLVVTLPVALESGFSGPMVTTRITEYRQAGEPATADVRIQIGGTVFDSAGTSVTGAWVRLETTSGEALQTTETDNQGRFTFQGLREGAYTLRVRSKGYAEVTRTINVPLTEEGGYDVHL